MHLNHLINKLVGELVFELKTPLHIGAGGFGAFRSLLRVDGRAVIPGSTIKGVFRRVAEYVAKSMTGSLSGYEKVALKCYEESEKGIVYVERSGDPDYDASYRRFVEALREQIRNSDFRGVELATLLDIGYGLDELRGETLESDVGYELFGDFLAANCPIGRLMGNGVLAGKFRVFDVFLDVLATHIRPGIGIERETGKVKENILRFTEVVPPGEKVSVWFVVDNLLPGAGDSKVFAGVLEWVERLGLQLGAGKSTGLGLLELVGQRFWLIKLGENGDRFGEVLANPFKTRPIDSLEQIVKHLRGE
ncbi:MAG: RAMP superfamily CRISPR-associated protein [Candidatus Caldarchaeum sp.]|uniref:CRISPR type III-associated protein domain-containing protein n=2 Tax=Caldiarchaeum subterraneum TaxID=311458 RepID=A0A7J3G5D3_CALS0|nr:RAMP superfamily CRISPR-associated protein [Candidatus Caldarchaeales archaeon]